MASIADVFVTVLPETGKIAEGIKKALLAADDDVREAARRWKRIIDRELAGADAEVEVDADTSKAEKKIEKLDKDAKAEVEVDAKVDKAKEKIDRVSRDQDVTINVDADVGKAEAKID